MLAASALEGREGNKSVFRHRTRKPKVKLTPQPVPIRYYPALPEPNLNEPMSNEAWHELLKRLGIKE